MKEIRGIRILLCVRVGDCLVQSTPHSDVVREIGSQSAVEVGRTGLQMSREAAVLHGKVIVLFLVHLLVDDILLGNLQGPARPSFVDF